MAWYEFDNATLVDTPALLFYRSRIEQNIQSAISITGNTSLLRPHIKTNKTKEVCRMMLSAGIEEFKCATVAEAELLGTIKAKDVLLAYQPVGPKIIRFINLIKAYPATHFSCLADNIHSAREISRVFKLEGVKATVWLDVNTGMNRTGVSPDAAPDLIDELLKLPAIELVGLHFYDGHIVNNDFEMRQRESDSGFAIVDGICNYFKNKTGTYPHIAGGGSPTFRNHIGRNIECTPGTFVFWDMGYHTLLPDEPFLFSALVMTRIVSIVNDTLITCDLGYKSVAAENPLPRVYFLNHPDAQPYYQNEEHLVLKVPNADEFKTGDILYGVPEHICPTVALYDEAVVIENNKATEQWEIIARRKSINY
jgi:D-serine deaminase-like pyridoxal phosphate-dependent protein